MSSGTPGSDKARSESRVAGRGEQRVLQRDATVQRALVFAGIAALAWVLLFLDWQVLKALLLVFAGVLLAVFLRSLAEWVAGPYSTLVDVVPGDCAAASADAPGSGG